MLVAHVAEPGAVGAVGRVDAVLQAQQQARERLAIAVRDGLAEGKNETKKPQPRGFEFPWVDERAALMRERCMGV